MIRGERGQALILIALAMPILIGGMGLAVDVGNLFVQRRSVQAAADAAAWAGAVQLWKGDTNANAIQAARDDATRNGYTNGTGGVTVTVNLPPASGSFSGNSSYVEVIIVANVRTTFIPGAVSGAFNVTGRAVGGNVPFSSTHAVITLDSSASPALSASGNGGLTAVGGGVQVNSSGSPAASLTGNADVTAPYTNVVGTVSTTGGAEFSPAASTGKPAAPDPFDTLPPPDTSALVDRGSVNATGGTTVLEPGIYSSISISGNATVKFKTGVYVIKGGGFSVIGNADLKLNTPGQGVLFYNTYSTYPSAATNPPVCGDYSVSGNGAQNLSAMSSGIYKGMFLWQDPNCTNDLTWTGNGASSTIFGTIYAPNATAKLSGNGTVSVTYSAQVIAKKAEVSGNANLSLIYNSGIVAQPTMPALVE